MTPVLAHLVFMASASKVIIVMIVYVTWDTQEGTVKLVSTCVCICDCCHACMCGCNGRFCVRACGCIRDVRLRSRVRACLLI